jgi:hypothetical protein
VCCFLFVPLLLVLLVGWVGSSDDDDMIVGGVARGARCLACCLCGSSACWS